MTRTEYMRRLSVRLKHLPREDFDRAMEYFQEYFDEAGAEKEQQAIQDLGDPQSAAEQIIMDLAVKNTENRPENMRRGFSAVWIGLLAVLAAPIGLPLAVSAVALIGCFGVVVLALLLSAFALVLVVVLSAVIGLAAGVWLIFTSPANGLATFGLSLLVLGLGLLAGVFSIWLCKICLSGISKGVGRMIKKRGGKKYEI